MDPAILPRFIDGTASDAEFEQCEQFLSDPQHDTDNLSLGSEPPLSPLTQAIRAGAAQQSTSVAVDGLIEKIQRLIPRHTIGPDELKRILDPAQPPGTNAESRSASNPESGDEQPIELGRIGRFRVLEFIACGGMGVVFKAEDPALGRLVCIKVLHPLLAANADAKSRFARESKAAASLRSDRIVTVLEVGEQRGLPFLVMQLLEGESLRDKLRAEGSLPPAEAKRLTIQIAEGLSYAHQRGYLHRDIKPENIWITPEGDIKLLDFGLAQVADASLNLTATGTILGTPGYMSPEQVQGQTLDPRSDLFSVGTVLYEMLSGESPFLKPNIFSTMMSVANESLELPAEIGGVSPSLAECLKRLLQKSPDARLDSAEDLIAQLQAAGSPGQPAPALAGANSLPAVQGRRGSGRSFWTAATSAAAGFVLCAAAFWLYQLNDKGTLVVEADPTVKVQIENETVSIVDPQTGKSFEVKIGEQPLASGVYQLELADPSGEFRLTSNIVTIRRGEKQIVRVELKPPVADVAADGVTKSGVTKSDFPVIAKTTTPAGVSVPDGGAFLSGRRYPNADQPPGGRAVSLATLPVLTAEQIQTKLRLTAGEPLSKFAQVTRPSKTDSASHWSVEPVQGKASWLAELNFDATRIAERPLYEHGFVKIWSRKGELQHLLPAHDKVDSVVWSPDPNVLAVLEKGSDRKQIIIWKLLPDHAAIIDVIASDANSFQWTADGLALLLKTSNDLVFYDLPKSQLVAIPVVGMDRDVNQFSLSSTRRFLVTKGNGPDTPFKVWDLKASKLALILSAATTVEFTPTGDRLVASFRDSPTGASRRYELWDMDSLQQVSNFSTNGSRLTSISPAFDRIAEVSNDGWTVLLQDLESESPVVLNLGITPAVDDALSVETPKLTWSPSGQHLMARNVYETVIFDLNDPDVARGPQARIQNTYRPRLHDEQETEFSAGRLASVDVARLYVLKRNIDSLDVASLSYFPTIAAQISVNRPLFMRLSGDGKHLALVATSIDSHRPDYNEVADDAVRELSKIRIYEVATGKLAHTIASPGFVKSLDWANDDKLVYGWQDAKSEEEERVSKLATLAMSASMMFEKSDLNEDRRISEEEAKDLLKRYTKAMNFDVSGDGLSFRELLASMLDARSSFRAPPQSRGTQSGILKLSIFDLSKQTSIELDTEQIAKQGNEDVLYRRSDNDTGIVQGNSIFLPVQTLRAAGGRGFQNQTNALAEFNANSGQLLAILEFDNCEFSRPVVSVSESLIVVFEKSSRSGRKDKSWIYDRRSKTGFAHEMNSNDWTSVELTPNANLFLAGDSSGMRIWQVDLEDQSVSLLANPRRIPKVSGKWSKSRPLYAWSTDTNAKDYAVHWYNYETGEVGRREIPFKIVQLEPLENGGWLLIGSGQIMKVDSAFEPIETMIAAEPWTDLAKSPRLTHRLFSNGGLSPTDATAVAGFRWVGWVDGQLKTRQLPDTQVYQYSTLVNEGFATYDANGDRQLSVEERQSIVPPITPPPESADTNDDGLISRPEWLQSLLEAQ